MIIQVVNLVRMVNGALPTCCGVFDKMSRYPDR